MDFSKILLILLLCSLSLKGEEKELIIACHHGKEMLPLVFSCIEEAEQSVELSLCIAGGDILHSVLQILEKRMQERSHLKVHLMAATTLLIKKDLDAIEQMGERFKDRFFYVYTMPVPYFVPEIITVDNHMKGVIVDERYYSIGGSNFDDALISEGTFTPTPSRPPSGGLRDQLPLGNRDQDVVGRGESTAKELRICFFKQFALWRHYNEYPDNFIHDPEQFTLSSSYFSLDSSKKKAFVKAVEHSEKKCFPTTVSVVASGPMDQENRISKTYEQLIKGAKEEIIIGNLYFQPTQKVMESLQAAVQRGVDCTLITNGLYDNSPFFCPFFAWASRTNYLPLLYCKEYEFWDYRIALRERELFKVHIFEYHIGEIMYHKKTMVVDRRWALIGSYNLGSRSHCCDYEVVLVIDSEDVANKFLAIYEEDKKCSEPISSSQAIDWYFDPLTSYLGALQKQIRNFL